MKPAAIDLSISDLSSSTLPIHNSSLSSFLQIGSGVPQYLERLKFQSTRLSSQLPNRPVPVDSGFQLIVLLSSANRSFTAVVRINQLSNG